MGDRPLPLTVFSEIILQRYMFSLIHSDSKEAKRLKNMPNFPKDFNLVVPEVEYYNPIKNTSQVNNQKKKTKKLHHNSNLSFYKPDFVIYPKKDGVKREPSLSGFGHFIEVKMTLEHLFQLNQWAGLFLNGNSIVASLSEISEEAWAEKCNEKVAEICKDSPLLQGSEWLKEPEKRVLYYSVNKQDFTEWYIKNAGTMLEDQLHDNSRPRYWLCVLSGGNQPSEGTLKNWNRMRNTPNIGKKRLWAWENKGEALKTLTRIHHEDEIIILFANQKIPHDNPKKVRWGNKLDNGKEATLKQIQKQRIIIHSMFLMKAKKCKKGYSPYHVKLGDEESATFFEKCTSSDCDTEGCVGCNNGERRSMNGVKWPHYLRMEEVGFAKGPQFERERGTIGFRWTEAGQTGGYHGNHPVELTKDEFMELKASCYDNLKIDYSREKSELMGDIENTNTIKELKELKKKWICE